MLASYESDDGFDAWEVDRFALRHAARAKTNGPHPSTRKPMPVAVALFEMRTTPSASHPNPRTTNMRNRGEVASRAKRLTVMMQNARIQGIGTFHLQDGDAHHRMPGEFASHPGTTLG